MSRGEQIKQERRRRNTDTLSGQRRKMALTERLDPAFEYRWANDEGTRLHELTVNDDYEVVQSRSGAMKPDGTGVGSEVAVPVGTGESGAQVRAVLLRKPKKYWNDDHEAKQRHIDELEAGIKQGATPSAGVEQGYVPSGGISVDHRGRS
jgi:hypothetical protein